PFRDHRHRSRRLARVSELDDLSGLTDEEHRLWWLYHDLFVALSNVLREQLLNNSGLSTSEFGVLAQVRRGGMRIRDICGVLGWEWSRVSHLVVRMEKRGLVTRHHCEDDARGTEVRITDGGLAAFEDASPKHHDAVRRYFFDELSDPERRQLTKVFQRL